MKVYKISIITPNYNYGNYIGQTIQSVIDQNYPDFEYIIVDDGSTDNSVEIIQSFVDKYPDKITLIQQENKGQTPAVNVALKHVTGDIIGWINSDDTYFDKAFNKIINAFNKYPDSDAVFGDIIIINKDDVIVKKNKYLKFDYASGVFNGFGKIIPSNAIFWKKKIMREVGYLDESYNYSMDSEYWSRLLKGKNIYKIDDYIANFRWHSKAKTILRKSKKSQEQIDAKQEDYKIFINSYRNLKISKFLSVKYSKPLKLCSKLKRLSLRFINGHYRANKNE